MVYHHRMVQSLFGVEEVRPGRGEQGHDKGQDHSAAFHCDLRICSCVITGESRDPIPRPGARTVHRNAPRILPPSFRAGRSAIHCGVSSPSFLTWRLTATLPWPWARLTERPRSLVDTWSLVITTSLLLTQPSINSCMHSSFEIHMGMTVMLRVTSTVAACVVCLYHLAHLISHNFLHNKFLRHDCNFLMIYFKYVVNYLKHF